MLSKRTKAKAISGWPRVFCLILLGIFAGAIAATWGNPVPLSPRSRFVPAMYFFPKTPGGTSLRFAMVHDILHERYLRHGSAWYEKRAELAREIITRHQDPVVPARLDAMDDLAVALIMLHREADAVEIMQKKLVDLGEPPAVAKVVKPADYFATDMRQMESSRELSVLDHHRYSAHANLGTALVHGSMTAALKGEAASEARLRDGLAETERAIELNPLAHFGRETWQAITVSHFLGCMEHPGLITRFTLSGERLEDGNVPLVNDYERMFARFTDGSSRKITVTKDFCETVRSRVARIAFDKEWVAGVHSPYDGEYPFDEPILGIVGMWTLGGGPNPHFALAIARTMQAYHERYVAWDAYERACEFPNGFWPTGTASLVLTRYCRDQQDAIPRSLAPGDPARWQAERRQAHAEELKWGQAYQQAYQEFERERILAGASLDDPHFYDAFFKGRPSIASAVGHADEFLVTQVEPRYAIDYLPCVMLGVGAVLLIDQARFGLVKRMSKRQGKAAPL